ncbi:MAG: amidohydrolase family protein, partial [Cyclobacteriaceae bacterium]
MQTFKGCRFLILLLTVMVFPWNTNAQDDLRPVSTKYAITNATIVQAPGRVIQNGTIIFENGVIQNIGSNIKIPADAWVIKADSMYVYAGFISGMSNIGVPKPKDERVEIDSKLKQNPPYDKAGITPGANVVDGIKKEDKSIDEFRKLGFTAAVTAPHSGMMPGRSAIILLSDSEPEAMVLKEDFSLYSQLDGASGMYPNTVIGVMAKYRDMYRKGIQGLDYQKRYAASAAGMVRPVRDLTIESLYPVINKEVPVSFRAEGVKDIMRVLTLKNELGFNLHLVEVQQGWDAINEIKKSGSAVFFSLDLPELKEEEKKEDKEAKSDDEKSEETPEEPKEKTAADLEQEALEMRQKEMLTKYYTQMAAYQSAGLKFGFSTLEASSKDFKKVLSGIIKNGLSEDNALAALTTNPASTLGVSSTMGSIDVGKMANLIVTDKPYFEEKSNVRYVFVDGKMNEYEVKKEKKKKSGGEPIDPKGTWQFEYSSEAGDSYSGNFKIEGEAGSYSGSLFLSFNGSTSDLTSVEV